MSLLIPPVYREPGGLPLYWGDEATGTLTAAVRAYYDECLEEGKMTPEQLVYVRAYLVHHINAPVWLEKNPYADLEVALKIGELRHRAPLLQSAADISAYVHDAMELALDPL